MSNIKRLKFKAGTNLIKENDLSRKLFILNKGKVRVYKTYMDGKITLAVLGPGEIFGELSFFDAKPRSASVEAVTDVEADVIDGELLNEDIEALPKWVHLVFKSVANRFREIDQQMTVFHSMNSFQKKATSTDISGEAIYNDLLKKTKVIKLIINEKGNSQTKDFWGKELQQITGETQIAPKSYLNVLDDYNILTYSNFGAMGEYSFLEPSLDKFETFLSEAVTNREYTVLTIHAHNLMRNIISFMDLSQSNATNKRLKLSAESTTIHGEDQDLEVAHSQLKKLKLIFSQSDGLYIQPTDFLAAFNYHSIIKKFDRSMITS
jgi:CRP/FNR family transcriptional regulator